MEMDAGSENLTPKTDDRETVTCGAVLTNLSDFVLKRVLHFSQDTKSIFLEGIFSEKPGSAVLLLEKEPFQEEDLKTLFAEEKAQEKVFQNDIYSYFRHLPVSVCNGIKITSIYPATEKHIQKYSYQAIHLINETPHLYKTVTLPHLQSEQFSLLWVYNILERKAETDRIVFEDSDPETGFILLPDLKWDGKTIESLHLLALSVKRGISSLRDLTDKELPLLKNIHEKGVKAVAEKYSVPCSQLRIYLHYQPSFYHLHVHFKYIRCTSLEDSVGRCHLLTTVINNIDLVPDYYQRSTLTFSVKESDRLFAKYESLGPGLRTCSVCVVLKRALQEAKVKIRKNMILLHADNRDYNIPLKDIEVEPLTMTCFSVDKQCVTFRVEVTSCPVSGPVPRLKKVLPVQPNQVMTMSCKCGCPVTEEVSFKRVLPLPSHGIELADMFCHCDSSVNSPLTPKPGDCLYSTHYISVGKDLLKNVKMNSGIKCGRCLASIGSYRKGTVRLWNVCLDIPREVRTPEEEFKRIVRQAIEESFIIFLKIFLECVEINSGLLLSVMDRQLLVSRSTEDLRLKTSNVLKLKYEYHNVCSENLRTFLEKEEVQCIEVPQLILSEGVNFLMKSSEDIPPQFRIVDGELMAYLEIST